jgi:hypothetical protein
MFKYRSQGNTQDISLSAYDAPLVSCKAAQVLSVNLVDLLGDYERNYSTMADTDRSYLTFEILKQLEILRATVSHMKS